MSLGPPYAWALCRGAAVGALAVLIFAGDRLLRVTLPEWVLKSIAGP